MSSPISVSGFNLSLSEVFENQSEVSQKSVRTQQESFRSQSGVGQESARSQSGVSQESQGLSEDLVIKFGELIRTALQIETWLHLQTFLSV